MPLAQTINPSAPTGRTGQGSGINNREDLSNELTMLKATKFPITLALKAGKATSILSEWPVDKLAAPQTDGVIEGQDADSFEDPFSDAARLQTRLDKLGKYPVDFAEWREDRAVYGSDAYVEYGQAEEIEWERRLDEEEAWA